MPLTPPLSVAVKFVRSASAPTGVRLTIRGLLGTVTVAGTRPLVASRKKNVLVVTVAASTASLNVAVKTALTLTLVCPLAGLTVVTTGAFVSGGTEVLKTRSTQ